MNETGLKMKYYLCVFLMVITSGIWAQNNSQMLDGIGETALIARYVFENNVKDWSRNNVHGELHGNGVGFVEDDQFDMVLSLSGEDNSFVSIPGGTIMGEESYSFSMWMHLTSTPSDQRFFDFRSSANSHVIIARKRNSDHTELHAALVSTTGQINEIRTSAIEDNEWVHLVLVADGPSKMMKLFIDGNCVDKKPLSLELKDVFGNPSGQEHRSKAIFLGGKGVTVRFHDFRIYRIPLSEYQVSTIYHKALGLSGHIVVDKVIVQDDNSNAQQLYNSYLTEVSDVDVVTEVGQLPRLPRYVQGKYQHGIQGPEVRVIWPAPTDNTEASKVGQYIVTGKVPGTELAPKAIIHVRDNSKFVLPQQQLLPFKLSHVSLDPDASGQPTKFIENREKFLKVLSGTNPDNFLYMFRNAYGIKQPAGAEPLGVWDSQETKLRGHASGHYLTAIAQAYASTTYDEVLQKNFAEKMDYMVNELYTLAQMSGMPPTEGGEHVADPTAVPPGPGRPDYDSDLSEEHIRTDFWNWGRGFISAYPPDQFIMLEHGATYGTQNTQIWAPYYTLHKILSGLMDVYEFSGNEKALEITKGMADWVHARLSQLPTETLISMWNRYIAGEYGGMNEAMARLYGYTKEPRYLLTAKLFDNTRVFFGDEAHTHGLAKNVDLFRGLHANQHIPQIVGSLETYRCSEIPEYYQIADNFWHKAVYDYSYCIGGVAGARNPANAECFTIQPASIYHNGLSEHGQNETCATYNLLKLTRKLFTYDPRAELMDYYEKGLYNHILASVAEKSPANTYHVPLSPGSVKSFGNPDMKGFTCCNGTALESSTKLQNSIYFKSVDDQSLYINLFVPSTLDWTERKIRITQVTSFPREDRTRIVINGKGKFDLNIRVPKWATSGSSISINGQQQKVEALPGSYIRLSRKWKDGDLVELHIPFVFHLEPIMDQQNIASLFYGPILLAAQEPEPRQEWRKITLNAKDISSSITGDPASLNFSIDGVEFKPFYDSYGRYSVYMDITLK